MRANRGLRIINCLLLIFVASFIFPFWATAGYYTYLPVPHGDYADPSFPITIQYNSEININITVHDRDTWNNALNERQDNDEIATIVMYITEGPGKPLVEVQRKDSYELTRRAEMGYVFYDGTFTLGPPQTRKVSYKYIRFKVVDTAHSYTGTPMADDPDSHQYLQDNDGGYFPINFTTANCSSCTNVANPCGGTPTTVCQTAPSSTAYNCWAWSVGYDNFIVWPTGSQVPGYVIIDTDQNGSASIAEWDEFYLSYGGLKVVPSATGACAAWNINHGYNLCSCINWESKFGGGIRATHGNGPLSCYGNPTRYYGP